MSYYLKRLYFAIVQRSQWLALALFPPLVYFAMSAVTADRFTVTQDVMLKSGVSVTAEQVFGMVSAGGFSERPDRAYEILRPTDNRTLRFFMPTPAIIRISYEGTDAENGTDLVEHYSGRLARGLGDFGGANILESLGRPKTESNLAIWRPQRAMPFLGYLGVSLVVVFLSLVVIEILDPTFKSERRAARHLGIPLLGSLPNFEKMAASMEERARQEERLASSVGAVAERAGIGK